MSDTQHFTAVQLKPVLGAELQWSRVVKSLAGVLSSRVQSTVRALSVGPEAEREKWRSTPEQNKQPGPWAELE